MATVSTPCIQRCVMDPARGLCVGCGRTLAEIVAWGTLGEADRHAIMASLPARWATTQGRPLTTRPPTRG